MPKSYITVSRNWNHPSIEITVSTEDIALKMKLEDFISIIKAELQSVSHIDKKYWGLKQVFNQDTFEQNLDTIVENIVEAIKEESAKVMS